MGKMTAADFLKSQIATITIEPVIFLNGFGSSLVRGIQLSQKLLLQKICLTELGFSEEICQDLSSENYESNREEVQIRANNFQMNSQWISSVPIIFFALIAGALSDEFGRKPLLLFPMIGYFIGTILMLINYAYLDVLPVEFFYLENISAFFGGYAVFYLGMYSFVTNVAKPKDRAHRLARLDGMELLGYIVGTFVSPVIYERVGSFGSYGLSAGFIFLAIAYLVAFVEEPIERKTEENKEKGQSSNWFVKALVTPFNGMKSLIVKKRKPFLKFLILLQFLCFFTYWVVIEAGFVTYLYMFQVFAPEFEDQDYANFSIFSMASSTVMLLIVVPFLNAKLRLHDSLMLVIIVTTDVIFNVSAPFATEVWQFYIATGIGALGFCKYAVVRSLLSKSITLDEVGKVFSLLALIAAIGPVIGNPIFRQLYNGTIDTFPGAIYLLSAAMLLFPLLGNFFLYTQRHQLVDHGTEESDGRKEENIETIDGSLEQSYL